MERRRMRTAAIVSLALALGALAAGCRGLLGIDDDAALLTSGDGASPGDDGAAATDGGTRPDAPLGDAGSDGAVSAVDRRYAQWPLPPPGPLLSQYDLAPEIVTDKVTGLMWQRPMPETTNYPGAVTACKTFAGGGHMDWRVPSRIELLTILDFSQSSDLLNKTVFPGFSPGRTWTASLSLLRAKLSDRYTVDLSLGTVLVATSDEHSFGYRCVRGGPVTSPVDRFVVANDTARDVRTGLVWQVTPLPTVLLFDEATAACAALVLGGFSTGWRLPHVRELLSLIDESREQTPLLPAIFAAGPAPLFWSSTTRTPSNASYSVDFTTSNISPRAVATETLSARCVR